MRFVRVYLAPPLLMLALLAGGGAAKAQTSGAQTGAAPTGNAQTGNAQTGDAQKGKVAFTQHGCWQCHDFTGQGSVATSNGKVIARTQLPLDAFISFVRTTNGQMPPFRPAILSDEDLTNIYAYLQSLPEPKSASDIPLLNNDVRTQ